MQTPQPEFHENLEGENVHDSNNDGSAPGIAGLLNAIKFPLADGFA